MKRPKAGQRLGKTRVRGPTWASALSRRRRYSPRFFFFFYSHSLHPQSSRKVSLKVIVVSAVLWGTVEGHRRTEQEREWCVHLHSGQKGGSSRCQVGRGAAPSRGRPHRCHQQKLHSVLTGEQGRTLSTLEVVPWERLKKKAGGQMLGRSRGLEGRNI